MAPTSTAALVRRLLDSAHALNHEAGPDGRGVPPFDREDPELHLRCVLVRGIRVSTNVGALVRAFACAGEIRSEAIEGLQRTAIVVFATAADAKKALEIPTRRVGFGTGVCEAVSREVLEESKNGLADCARPRLRLLSASQFKADLETLIRNALAKVADASATGQAMDEQDEEAVVDDTTKKQVPDEQSEEAVVVDATKKQVPDEQNVVADEENKQKNTCATLRRAPAMEDATATLRRALGIAMPKSSEAEATKPPQAAASSPSRTNASSVPVAAETAGRRPSVPASGSDATWSVSPTGGAGAIALRKPQKAKIPGVGDGALAQQPRETPQSDQPHGTPALTAETQQLLARCFELIQRAVQLLEKCTMQQGRCDSGKIRESV